jgi:hypothetical protein
VGVDGRSLLARVAGGIWPLADGLPTLREMAARRPLAAHRGDPPVLANNALPTRCLACKWHCREKGCSPKFKALALFRVRRC